jgi:hypothetical protein
MTPYDKFINFVKMQKGVKIIPQGNMRVLIEVNNIFITVIADDKPTCDSYKKFNGKIFAESAMTYKSIHECYYVRPIPKPKEYGRVWMEILSLSEPEHVETSENNKRYFKED